ncbi:hypothetical protein M9458_004287, partial [Cirrhinus mrigala]
HIQDPASQRLTWSKPPLNVLVIRKIRDETLLEPFKELCRFLVEICLRKLNLNYFHNQEKHLMVYVEKKVVDDGSLMMDDSFSAIRNQLCTFRE